MTKETNLLRIPCHEGGLCADVVFVHGVNGDARKTWEPLLERSWNPFKLFRRRVVTGGFWPEWLAEALPGIRVWCLAYPAAATRWQGSGMALPSRAKQVLEVLRLEGLGNRKIIFIAHSLGGLLVKTMLRIANDRNQRDWKRLAAATCGILFLATPHAGSPVASVLNIFRMICRLNPTIRDVEDQSPYLEELNEWYQSQFCHLNHLAHVLREGKPVKGVMVVSRASAHLGIPSVQVIDTDATHITICKPTDRNSFVYKSALDFVKLCLEQNPASQPSNHSADEVAVGPSDLPAVSRLPEERASARGIVLVPAAPPQESLQDHASSTIMPESDDWPVDFSDPVVIDRVWASELNGRWRHLDLGRTRCRNEDLAVLASDSRIAEYLEVLNLTDTQVDDGIARDLSRMRKLKKLVLNGTKIGLRVLDVIVEFPQLTSLSLGYCANVDDAWLELLGKCRGLITLSLAGTQITSGKLGCLVGLNKLQKLDLDLTRISTLAGLAPLLPANGGRLTEVTVLGCEECTFARERNLTGLGGPDLTQAITG